MNYSVHIISLGCPKNLVDTEAAAGSLAVAGVAFANDPSFADIIFINTCAFIQPARDEAREEILGALEWKRGEKRRKVIVGGCLVQWDTDQAFAREFPDVDLWLPVDNVPHLARHLEALFDSRGKAPVTPPPPPTTIVDNSAPRLRLTPPSYAYLKISEGCSNHCAYCAIPAIRGRPRHRSIPSLLEEVKHAVSAGIGEIIITAQDTTAYSCPESQGRLPELVHAMNALEGEFAIRLLYAHPARMSDDIVALFSESGSRLLPYIDLPMQHISDKLLKAMNRGIDSIGIHRVIDDLRSHNPNIAIRTTFITGFPGETERDFRELMEFVREQGFARLGVFDYSDEPNTPAHEMTAKISAETAKKRKDSLMEMQSDISLEYNKRLKGRTMEVAIDGFDEDGLALGRTVFDAPDIDNVVLIHGTDKIIPGTVAQVNIISATPYALSGIPAPDSPTQQSFSRGNSDWLES